MRLFPLRPLLNVISMLPVSVEVTDLGSADTHVPSDTRGSVSPFINRHNIMLIMLSYFLLLKQNNLDLVL